MERTQCAVFISWTRGSLAQLTWESTDGGLLLNSIFNKFLQRLLNITYYVKTIYEVAICMIHCLVIVQRLEFRLGPPLHVS